MTPPSTVLIITGAAATGKSTTGDHLRSEPGLLVLDGDVIGRGAAATADGRRDYVGFWRYVLTICREVRSNGLVPVVPCICLPGQVLAATTDEVVHFLALLSEPDTVRRRIAGRTGVSEVPAPETHADLDRRLHAIDDVPRPHSWSTIDVATTDLAHTLERAEGWARERTS